MADAGRPTKYKPEYDEEIVKLASLTIKNHMYRIAAGWDVCVETLHEWRRVHLSFSEAYARARGHQNAFLFDLIIDGTGDRNFNSNAANLLAIHLSKLSKERSLALAIEGASISDKAKSIINDLRNGKMSASEFSQVMSGISTAVKIQEVTDLDERTKALEKKAGIEKNGN